MKWLRIILATLVVSNFVFLFFIPSISRHDNLLAIEHDSISRSSVSSTKKAFSGWQYVYAAHADPPNVITSRITQIQDKPFDTYATVVGSLSGLNALLHINPREIIFYDVNPQAVEFGRLFVGLVSISKPNRRDFLSRMYGRAFLDQGLDVRLENQFKTIQIDQEIVQDTRSRLPLDLKKLYDFYIDFWMVDLFKAAEGIRTRRVCERILPYHDPWKNPKLKAGDLSVKGDIHYCTWYLGHGWLETDETFARVQSVLHRATFSYMTFNIVEQNLDIFLNASVTNLTRHPNVLFFTSNIMAFIQDPITARENLINVAKSLPAEFTFLEAGRYQSFRLKESEEYNVNGSKFSVKTEWCALANTHMRKFKSSHDQAWQGLCELIVRQRWKLGTEDMLDICGKHVSKNMSHPYFHGINILEVTHKFPWGFYELDEVRENMSVHDFLLGDIPGYRFDLIILHILVGEGESREVFASALKKALKLSPWIIVLEHERDFDWSEQSPRSDGNIEILFSKEELIDISFRIGAQLNKTISISQCELQSLYKPQCRNMFVVLKQ